MVAVLICLQDDIHVINERPSYCPHCGNPVLQRWGQVNRDVQDARTRSAEIYRFRCSACERTFRVYPQGIDRINQTLRIRFLAALTWAMGMSCRDVVRFFEQMGVQISRMVVWRGGKEFIEKLQMQGKLDILNRYNLDSNFIPYISSRLGVVIILELEPGNSKILGVIDEYNPLLVKDWLENLIEFQDIMVKLVDTDTFKKQYELSTVGISS